MSHTPGPGKPLHPFCNVCGWHKGGIDSWDGRRCKCGDYEPPMKPMTDAELIAIAKARDAA